MQRRLAAALTGLLVTILAPLAGAAEFRILRYEPLTLSEAIHPQSSTAGRTVSPGMALRFHAFDTDFVLDLEPNGRINGAIPLRDRNNVAAFRGAITGRKGSWARLTRANGRISGMIYDGHELYAIESAARARPFIRNPLAMPADDAPVIYRLSDTLTDLEGEFCGVQMTAGVSTQADVFNALAAQLQADPIAHLTATKQLEVGVVADVALAMGYGNETTTRVATRMNVIDGIFSSQVGVHLSVPSITVFGTDPSQLNTNASDALLSGLSDYRSREPAQFQNTGLTHLMTGRNLVDNTGNSSTVGVAFVGRLCGANAVSISEGLRTDAQAVMIAAHEIGHNFGAPHDGEVGSACAAEPTTFIMSPQLSSGNQPTFSGCSLTEMSRLVSTSPPSCLATIAQSDAALVVPAIAPLALNQTTVVTFSVRSQGPAAITNVQIVVALPAGITPAGAGVVGGTCQIPGQSQILCLIASIPADESRVVEMSLVGLAAQTRVANIALTAISDSVSDNNNAQITLVTAPGADLSVGVSASSTAIETNATAVATITVTNLSAVAATGTRLSAVLPTGLVAVSVAPNVLGCTVDATPAFTCPAVSLAASSSQVVALTVRATSAGSRRLNVAVTSQLGDPDAANNNAGVTLTVTDPVVVIAPPSTPASSGGGGQLTSELLVLAVALEISRRRRARRSCRR